MDDTLLPPDGRLNVLSPLSMEEVRHDSRDVTGIGLDHAGRLSLCVAGQGLRATMTPAQMASLGMLLIAAAEEVVARADAAARRASDALAAICEARGAYDA